MSNVAKLKKQAAELELKKQFDKALPIYIKLLDSFDEYASELDVALFNRVGDLLLRQGNVADAVDYYERAVDRYADTGFFNNAIALCNKIMRHSPGRASVYYKLGKISAQKGFAHEAKVNFLEYADRMQKAGKFDEAFRALKEFADLCPDQDEIRLMLAEQLTRAHRKTEAIEQLQTLHEGYDSEGRASEAAATVARMRAIDPEVRPRSASGGRRKTTSGGLVFLDLDTPPVSGSYQRQPTPPSPPPAPARNASVPPPPPDPVANLPLINTDPVIGTPPATPAVEDPLADIMLADESLGVVKSTPTSSLFAVEDAAAEGDNELPASPPAAVEEAGDELVDGLEPQGSDDGLPLASTPISVATLVAPTPPSSAPADDAEATVPVSTPPDGAEPAVDLESAPSSEPQSGVVEEAMALPTPPAAMTIDSSVALREVEADTPAAPLPATTPSIDFELSELITPSGPVESGARATDVPSRSAPVGPSGVGRPTPNTTREALDGLPLMDLELPEAPPRVAPLRTQAATPLTADFELIVDPALGMKSEVTDAPSPSAVVGARSFIDLNAESLTLDDDAATDGGASSVGRRSTLVAVHAVEVLQASVANDPDNWSLHRELAEAMLEAGNREGGIRELELAMNGADRFGDLDLASSLAEEIARLEPDEVRHHQKRVEYAFRTNDRSRLIEAYIALADTLLATDQGDKARTVYQRVLDLAPDEPRARAAIDTLAIADLEPPAPPAPRVSGRQRTSAGGAAPTSRNGAAATSDGFIDLGDWLRDDAGPKDTRMVVDEHEPSGDEEADFADMLRRFKQGVAENVEAEDYQSHYDLAIAFKEMGLLDEAISEFQRALGSPTNRAPTYEALGQCFVDKGQYKLAASVLTRALNEGAAEEQLVGVLYLLGRCAEAQDHTADAVAYYQRVFVLDIQFRDIADRLSALERVTR